MDNKNIKTLISIGVTFGFVLLMVIVLGSGSKKQSEIPTGRPYVETPDGVNLEVPFFEPEVQRALEEQPDETLWIGELGMVNDNEDPKDCSGTIALGVSERAYVEHIRVAIIEPDIDKFDRMFSRGEMFFVENCTLVIRQYSGGIPIRMAEVTIVDSRYPTLKLKTGWVPYEYAIKLPE